VDDLKPQRHPFQFSLRKLMLWMVVCAAYLSSCRLAGMPTHATVFGGLWLGAIVVIRSTIGIDLGFPVGFAVAVFVTACFFVGYLFWGASVNMGWKNAIGVSLKYGLLVTLPTAVLAYVPISLLVWAVDRIDALMQIKPPKDS
jgi:hypothetical protein